MSDDHRRARFEQLVLIHMDAAHGLASWLMRNESQAEEAVQEAYLRAFRFFASFRGGDARPWLLGIVRNTCYTLLERERASASPAEFQEESHGEESVATGAVLNFPINPETAAIENAERALVQQCLRSLPAEYREALVLRELTSLGKVSLRGGRKTRIHHSVIRCALVCACCAYVLDASASDVAIKSTTDSFADVKERLVFAIENRGIVVNYTARVGAMLERTGGDIGSSRPIYAHAEVIEFCSATLSRATMEADPHNVAYCPYSIAVYVLAGERERAYVSYRRLGTSSGADASRRALLAVEELMADIVREALK